MFFNVSVLVFGALLAKIASNFAFDEPGFAGYRVQSPNTKGFFTDISNSCMERTAVASTLRSDTKILTCPWIRPITSNDIWNRRIYTFMTTKVGDLRLIESSKCLSMELMIPQMIRSFDRICWK